MFRAGQAADNVSNIINHLTLGLLLAVSNEPLNRSSHTPSFVLAGE